MDMNLLRTWLQARLHFGERDERGANLVEYILLICRSAMIAPSTARSLTVLP